VGAAVADTTSATRRTADEGPGEHLVGEPAVRPVREGAR
jgi:hypothetical protein